METMNLLDALTIPLGTTMVVTLCLLFASHTDEDDGLLSGCHNG